MSRQLLSVSAGASADVQAWPELGASQAERLRRTRETRGFSLRHLAALYGVSPQTIRAIEAGGKGASRSDVLAAIADALVSLAVG